MISILNGRKELIGEVARSSRELRNFLSATFKAFLETEAFLESIPSHLLPDPANQARYGIVFDRINQIANMGNP